MTTRSKLCRGAAAVFLAVALWQIGSAALIAGKAWLAPVLIDQAWARTLAGDGRVRPWDWADTYPVAELHVPDLGVRRIALANVSMRNLAFGPTVELHGETRIFYAHRDTHFRFLKDVEIGTEIALTEAEGGPRLYKIRERAVLDKDAIALPQAVVGQDALMLVTCYPFDDWEPNGPLRYVVWATPRIP